MKLNEITNQHAEIEAYLDSMCIRNYTIRPDGTVDVNGNVRIYDSGPTLPIKFGKVTGYFDCSASPHLESLRGAPTHVDSWFSCTEAKSLKTLEGGPTYVGGSFYCFECTALESLKGAPLEIGKEFNCADCTSLLSLEGVPESISSNFVCAGCTSLTSLDHMPSLIGGDFRAARCDNIVSLEGFNAQICDAIQISWSNIKSGGIALILSGAKSLRWTTMPFHIIQKYLGRPEDIFECQMELIEAEFEEYAKL